MQLMYVGEKSKYDITFKKISTHIVQIIGNLPIKEKGFILFREDVESDLWDYKKYKTVYRKIEGGAQFSDDGSVYVAPLEPEPMPEPEPYVPTLEEVKAMKLQEIGAACEQTVYAGVDVELPTGTEHFSLTEKDQLNLFGKQAQMAAGAERFEYHQDGCPCRYYTKEEMQMIVETALSYVTYHTTYCNSLNIWIAFAETVEAVNEIVYGCDVPEEYQSEVLRDILMASHEAESEEE